MGGYVRDLLLGEESHDLDYATDALPEETAAILEKHGLKAIPVGMEFGTVGTLLEHLGETVQVEITTFRCGESYRKGSRHPEVVFGTSLEEDLRRRDFTVNAMAMGADGEVIDPFGGREDLEKRIIRTPLDPVVTFREDPLRMLRAARFMARLGFGLDPPALSAIASEAGSIREISRERWKLETDGLLCVEDGGSVASALQLLRETGLLLEMIPELGPLLGSDGEPHGKAHEKDLWGHTLDVIGYLPARTGLRWAGLLHDIGKPDSASVDEEGVLHYYGHEDAGSGAAADVAMRFRFSRREKSRVVYLVRNHMRPVLYTEEWGDAAVRRLAADAGVYLEDLLDLAEADIRAHTDEYRERGLRNLYHLCRRIRQMDTDPVERVLPRELGSVLAGMLGDSGGEGRRIGLLLTRLEELVHQGELPAMAEPSFYLDYLRDRNLLED